MHLNFVKGPPDNTGPSRHGPLTKKVLEAVEQLIVAKSLGEIQHVAIECTGDEHTSVRSAVHAYRKDKKGPIYVTLHKMDKSGNRFTGSLFLKDEEIS